MVPAGAQTYTCLPATDSTAIIHRDYIVQLVTATDSASVVHRIRYSLPTTTASKVTVITTANICSQAGDAYHNAVRPGPPPISRTLVVIKVGTNRYVVVDEDEKAGEFTPTVVFDRNWVKLAAWDS